MYRKIMHIREDQIEIKHAKLFFQIKTNIKSSNRLIEILELQWGVG